MAVTAMGWNQIVSVKETGGSTWKAIKVSDYNVGVKNEFETPALISGLTDKITWSKGLITVEGDISAPLTKTLAGNLLKYGLYDSVTQNLTQIDVKCTISNPTNNAMINSLSITATAEEFIQTKVSLWGVLGDTTGQYTSSYTAIENPIYEINSDAVYFTASTAASYPADYASNSGYGVNDTTIKLEQIPMFDQVTNVKKLMPDESMGEPISVSFEVDNKLMRNYTLGQNTLDAYSVSAGQREVTGEITWQSNDGQLGYITIGGTKTLSGTVSFGGIINLNVADVVALYGAAPPVLTVNDRVTASCRYQLLNTKYGFMAISITEV